MIKIFKSDQCPVCDILKRGAINEIPYLGIKYDFANTCDNCNILLEEMINEIKNQSIKLNKSQQDE